MEIFTPLFFSWDGPPYGFIKFKFSRNSFYHRWFILNWKPVLFGKCDVYWFTKQMTWSLWTFHLNEIIITFNTIKREFSFARRSKIRKLKYYFETEVCKYICKWNIRQAACGTPVWNKSLGGLIRTKWQNRARTLRATLLFKNSIQQLMAFIAGQLSYCQELEGFIEKELFLLIGFLKSWNGSAPRKMTFF